MITGFINGCFDIIHRGHIELLCFGYESCDRLMVGINSDYSVKQFKGLNRPINNENDRKFVLESISYVDEVVIFNELNCSKLLLDIKPQIWFKGSQYKNNLNKEESDMAKKLNIEIKYFDMVENHSTTNIIKKLEKTL